jgi:DHA2 family multidrug resistance protein
LTERASALDPTFTQSLSQMGRSTGLDVSQQYGLFDRMVTQQAAQLAVNDIFYLSAAIFIVLISLIWITRPERAGGGDASAAASAAH